MFFWEISEMFKKTSLTEHLRVTSSEKMEKINKGEVFDNDKLYLWKKT